MNKQNIPRFQIGTEKVSHGFGFHKISVGSIPGMEVRSNAIISGVNTKPLLQQKHALADVAATGQKISNISTKNEKITIFILLGVGFTLVVGSVVIYYLNKKQETQKQ